MSSTTIGDNKPSAFWGSFIVEGDVYMTFPSDSCIPSQEAQFKLVSSGRSIGEKIGPTVEKIARDYIALTIPNAESIVTIVVPQNTISTTIANVLDKAWRGLLSWWMK